MNQHDDLGRVRQDAEGLPVHDEEGAVDVRVLEGPEVLEPDHLLEDLHLAVLGLDQRVVRGVEVVEDEVVDGVVGGGGGGPRARGVIVDLVLLHNWKWDGKDLL